MAKLITITRGKKSNRGIKSEQTTGTAIFGHEIGVQSKMPYALAIVVAALLCLYVAVAHTRSLSGDKELSLAQARNQVHHKYGSLKS